MQTTNIQSPAATATAAAMAPVVSPVPVPAMPNTPAAAAPLLPALSPGHQSSEFYLALVVVATIVAALWAGKLDPTLASALLGLIVSGYPSLRTWLKAQHVDAMADVLAASIKNGGGAVALGALAGAVDQPGGVADGSNGNDGTNGMSSRPALTPLLAQTLPQAAGTIASTPATAAPSLNCPHGPADLSQSLQSQPSTLNLTAASVIAALLLLPGCAGTPYYVSGINGTVDTSKDGSQITGGGVGVAISPNPNYPLPRAASSGQAPAKGLAK